MPTRAYNYYHSHCYGACPILLPEGKRRELSTYYVADTATCSSCGEPLKEKAMKDIFWTITSTNTGLYLDERGAVQTVYAKDTPTAQPPAPLRESAEVEQRLAEMRPDDRFKRVLLSEPDFWRKVSEIRTALTMTEEESAQLNSFYSGVEN